MAYEENTILATVRFPNIVLEIIKNMTEYEKHTHWFDYSDGYNVSYTFIEKYHGNNYIFTPLGENYYICKPGGLEKNSFHIHKSCLTDIYNYHMVENWSDIIKNNIPVWLWNEDGEEKTLSFLNRYNPYVFTKFQDIKGDFFRNCILVLSDEFEENNIKIA